MKKLMVLLGCILWSCQLWSAIYYIDPTCSSSGNGTTTTCGSSGPFRTWAEVSWAAGNTYSQKAGTTAYETIMVGASGTDGHAITLNSYGTGKANLDGGTIIDPATWTPNDPITGVYSHAALGYGIFQDGVRMKNASSLSCDDTPYYYDWYTSSRSYYKPSVGTISSHILKQSKTYGINLGANNYIIITGFNIQNYTYGIYGGPSGATGANSDITITDNDLTDLHFGIYLAFNGGAESTRVTVTHNTLDYIREGFEATSKGDCRGGTGEFSFFDISYNTIKNGNYIRGASYTWEDVNVLDWDEEGIGFQSLTNSSVHHNSISGNIRGIVFFVCAGLDGKNNNFYSNYIKAAKDALYFQPAATAASFYNNNVYYNVLISTGTGTGAFNVSSKTIPDAQYSYIYNNTIVGNVNGLYFQKNSDYYYVGNNILISASSWAAPVTMLNIVKPEHMVIDYNLYFHGTQSSWYTQWSTPAGVNWDNWNAFGYDANSLGGSVDPLFARSNILGASGDWSNEGSNIWSKSSDFPTAIIFDSIEVGRFAAPSTLTSKYRYNYAYGKLSVYATSNPTTYFTAMEAVSSLDISPGSPAKWRGVDVAKWVGGDVQLKTGSDFLGNSVHTPPSIGAYEFQPPPFTAPLQLRIIQ